MSTPFKQEFQEGVSLDTNESKVKQTQAVFIKNMTANVNANPNSASGAGFNLGVYTPLEGNILLPVTLPSGTNYCIGFYSSEETNEGYAAIYNSAGQHCLLIIRGDTGVVQIVYQGPLLAFILKPEFFLAEGRMTMQTRSFIDKTTGLQDQWKFILFTFGKDNQYYINVEDSIATSSFSTSYFTTTSAFYDPIELIHLGVPTPMSAIGVDTPNAYVPVASDKTKQNSMSKSARQYRIKTIDIFGRESEHGIISDIDIPVEGGGCISTSNGLPRCRNLNFDAGNPLVDKIQVEFREWIGNERSGSIATNWNIYEVFDKYDNSAAVKWYSRGYNPVFTTSGSGITFNVSTNLITYTFCGDKSSIPIPVDETTRTQSALARSSGSAFMVNNTLGLANNKRNFEPIAQSMIDKVVFSVKLPEPSNIPCPAAPLRTITFYAVIYKPIDNEIGVMRTTHDKVVWGNVDGACGDYGSFSLDQVFGDQDNPGFIACLRGTNYKVIGTQGDLDPTTGIFTAVGYAPGITFKHKAVIQFTVNDVPAGQYIGQIASHKAMISDGDIQRTSTNVAGLASISDLSVSGGLLSYASDPLKEILFDCSSGDVKLNSPSDKIFVILDLGINSTDGSAAIDGYLYEQNGQDIPIEMCPVFLSGVTETGSFNDTFGSFFTDHNGFFFGATKAAFIKAFIFSDICDGAGVVVRNIYNISNTVQSNLIGNIGGIVHGDGSGGVSTCLGVHGNWKNRVYLFSSTDVYPNAARRVVNQKITSCDDNSIGVPGIPVVMTKCGSSMTDTSGMATLIAHNRYNYSTSIGSNPLPWLASSIPDYTTVPYILDSIVFSQKGGCEWNVCGSCSTYMSAVIVNYLFCGENPAGCTPAGLISKSDIDTGGTGYALGDTFTVDDGSVLANGVVTAAVSGVVTMFSITSPGAGYSNIPIKAHTTTTTSGVGSGLVINILGLLPALRTLCLPELNVKPSGFGLHGLQSGGRYPVGFTLYDRIGRHDAVQRSQGAAGFVDIPNLNDINSPYPTFALCNLSMTILAGFAVDPVFTKLIPCVGANVLFSDFFDWAADWVTPVDNTGAQNTVNPTGLRIYYGSLNEYNKQNNFSSNTSWQFITDTEGVQLQAEGDIIQFIANGDGSFFPSVISAPITYDKNGLFFTLDYLPELAGLTNGALFRVIRPSLDQSGVNAPLYEQNLVIDLVNGAAAAGTYVLPYKDSYLMQRLIPVPVLKGQPGGIAPGVAPSSPILYTSSNDNTDLDNNGYSTNNVNNNNAVVRFELRNYPTSFPFYFESPSASDTNYSHVASWGRPMFADPYEREKRIGTEIHTSAKTTDRNNLNNVSYFSVVDIVEFDRGVWGDINSVLVETSTLLVICENDHFITTFNTSDMHARADGSIAYENQFGMFTAPSRKKGNGYGCGLADINTIRKYAGKACWLDSSGYLVFHDFTTAKPVQYMGYDGYLKNKISRVNLLNHQGTNGITYFMGSIDPKTWEYVFSSFNIPQTGNPSYINELADVNPAVNETLIIDLETGMLKCMPSFTPEYYGLMPGYYLQTNFLSFKNGKPYIHHNGVTGTGLNYNNFFGVQCKKRVTLVVNIGNDKVKRFMWNEVYCQQHLFVALKITTDRGQLSRLLKEQWDRREKFYAAAYLCDLNTPVDPNIPVQTGANVILDGDQLSGQWMKVEYSSQDADDSKYCELYSIVNYVIGIDPSAD